MSCHGRGLSFLWCLTTRACHRTTAIHTSAGSVSASQGIFVIRGLAWQALSNARAAADCGGNGEPCCPADGAAAMDDSGTVAGVCDAPTDACVADPSDGSEMICATTRAPPALSYSFACRVLSCWRRVSARHLPHPLPPLCPPARQIIGRLSAVPRFFTAHAAVCTCSRGSAARLRGGAGAQVTADPPAVAQWQARCRCVVGHAHLPVLWAPFCAVGCCGHLPVCTGASGGGAVPLLHCTGALALRRRASNERLRSPNTNARFIRARTAGGPMATEAVRALRQPNHVHVFPV